MNHSWSYPKHILYALDIQRVLNQLSGVIKSDLCAIDLDPVIFTPLRVFSVQYDRNFSCLEVENIQPPLAVDGKEKENEPELDATSDKSSNIPSLDEIEREYEDIAMHKIFQLAGKMTRIYPVVFCLSELHRTGHVFQM